MRDEEYADFTVDLDWMPRTVLLAKSTYVWLEQLSRRYHYPIKRLDQIPDEELDELAHSGFTSLWLIGVWQRSQASLKVKTCVVRFRLPHRPMPSMTIRLQLIWGETRRLKICAAAVSSVVSIWRVMW